MPERLRMTVEYDGTCFEGWQIQRTGRTVQGEIEACLARLLGRRCRVTGSGRTDAGVHAAGQVAHVDLSSTEIERVMKGLPEIVPQDIALRCIERAPEGFHARFSAFRRTYSYRIVRRRNPLLARFAWECPWAELDEEAMEAAAGLSLGRAGWRGMSREGGGNRTWLVDVGHAAVETGPEGWTLSISADRFLRGMVRIWAGTLVEAGRGRFPPSRITEILTTGDRLLAGPSLPARGLTLVSVEYRTEES